MGLHDEPGPVFLKPTAAVAVSNFDEIHGAVVFVGPFRDFDAAEAGVDENAAARAKQGNHAPVGQPDVAVTKTSGWGIGNARERDICTFRASFEQFGSFEFAWTAERIESPRRQERFAQMSAGRREGGAVVQSLLKAGFVPRGDLERIEMENGRQRIEFMKARNDIAVFDVGEAAEMENEIGTAPLDGDFVAGFSTSR